MLTFTDKAQEMVLTFMDQGDGEIQALRIHANGGSPVAPQFELTLVDPKDHTPQDMELDGGGFKVFVDPDSAKRLDGATVDFVQRVNGAGFEVLPPRPELPAEAPQGELADKIQMILDQQVNPQIASHGGRIDLVGVEGTEIYMEMSGGCQGCAMSRMTLRQGVERMIQEAAPEVTAIHDITDHSAGDNPYFT